MAKKKTLNELIRIEKYRLNSTNERNRVFYHANKNEEVRQALANAIQSNIEYIFLIGNGWNVTGALMPIELENIGEESIPHKVDFTSDMGPDADEMFINQRWISLGPIRKPEIPEGTEAYEMCEAPKEEYMRCTSQQKPTFIDYIKYYRVTKSP